MSRKVYRIDNSTFSGLGGRNKGYGFKLGNGDGEYNLTSDGKRIKQAFRVYHFLEKTKEGVDIYYCLDRHGNKRLFCKLVGDDPTLYPFLGNTKYSQNIFIVDNNGKNEPRFIEEGKELSLEEMLKSQLQGHGQNIYLWDPVLERIGMADKSNLDVLINLNDLLRKLYSEIQAKK
ncbi:MAG: hypothetical protein AABX55_03125 [Nanoarchaeota archaeon]